MIAIKDEESEFYWLRLNAEEVRDLAHLSRHSSGCYWIWSELVPILSTLPARKLLPSDNELLDRAVSTLELSIRAEQSLKSANIQTVRDLIQRSERDLLLVRNFGRKSLREIKEILFELDLQLEMTLPPPPPRPKRIRGHKLTTSWSGERGEESTSTGECVCGWTESCSNQGTVREEYRRHLDEVWERLHREKKEKA